MIRYFLALIALATPSLAFAADDMVVLNEIFVERTVPAPGGKTKVVLEKVKSGAPGAKLVFVMSYRNQGKGSITGFGLTDPIPSGVVFNGAITPGTEVSVNGGQSWGQLAALSVRSATGVVRPAQNEDVTHIRIIVRGAVAPGATGKLSFRAIVK